MPGTNAARHGQRLRASRAGTPRDSGDGGFVGIDAESNCAGNPYCQRSKEYIFQHGVRVLEWVNAVRLTNKRMMRLYGLTSAPAKTFHDLLNACQNLQCSRNLTGKVQVHPHGHCQSKIG